MALWFRRVAGLDTATMRKIAQEAGVSWSAKSIVYRADGVGYADGDPADATAIQDAAESVIGIRPVEIDPPDKE